MIRVLFFGKISDLIDQREIVVPYEVGLTLHQLRDMVFGDLFASQAVAANDIHMSVNQIKTRDDIHVNDADEIAFFQSFQAVKIHTSALKYRTGL